VMLMCIWLSTEEIWNAWIATLPKNIRCSVKYTRSLL
jgi:hypothetical protein